jgi:hypothetical protein
MVFQNFAKSLWRQRRPLCAAHHHAPILPVSLGEESVSDTQSQKPVVVFDGREWRRYHSDRHLLEHSLLGDVIPELTNHSADEPAAAHTFACSDAPADIVSTDPPNPQLWRELRRIWSSIENERPPRLDEICRAAIEGQSRE